MEARISWGPESGVRLCVYPNAPEAPLWKDGEAVCLDGFPTFWDAWAFCVAALGVDPLGRNPAWAREWTNRPPEDAGREVVRQGRLW